MTCLAVQGKAFSLKGKAAPPLSWPPVEGRARGDRLLELSCEVVGLPSTLDEDLLKRDA